MAVALLRRLNRRLTRIAAWLGHYTSLDCLHSEHDDCGLTCRLCNAPCQCRCHAARIG